MKQIAISVDLELFTDTFAFQKRGVPWCGGENGETGVDELLALFEEHRAKATFFVVAEHVKHHGRLIREIDEAGHEVSSHSLTHAPFPGKSAAELDREVRGSREVLEDAVGRRVLGFRAPAFGIDVRVATAIDRAGYAYDSSVVPCVRIPGWYGVPGAPCYPFPMRQIYPEIRLDLMEFPVAINPVIRTPLSGLWMRLLGSRYLMWGVESMLRRGAIPVLHVHPWELVQVPRTSGIPWRMYYRIGRPTRNTIEDVLEIPGAQFVRVCDLLEAQP